jgi:hypothetical protein
MKKHGLVLVGLITLVAFSEAFSNPAFNGKVIKVSESEKQVQVANLTEVILKTNAECEVIELTPKYIGDDDGVFVKCATPSDTQLFSMATTNQRIKGNILIKVEGTNAISDQIYRLHGDFEESFRKLSERKDVLQVGSRFPQEITVKLYIADLVLK